MRDLLRRIPEAALAFAVIITATGFFIFMLLAGFALIAWAGGDIE